MPPQTIFGDYSGLFERGCIFIDGENLRHSIIDLFQSEFKPADYLPKNALWEDFFNDLTTKSEVRQRVRTYWYVVQFIDFWPWQLPSDDPPKLEKIICSHPPFKTVIDPLVGDERSKTVVRFAQQLADQESRMSRRFKGWDNIHRAITHRFDGVEFRKAGAIAYNLFDRQFGSEKAVDVKLSVDLLELRTIYDVAIIVSGDQDYIPAVQAIKDSGKRVVNVSFRTRDGRLLPGGARRLNEATDKILQIDHDAMKKYLNL